MHAQLASERRRHGAIALLAAIALLCAFATAAHGEVVTGAHDDLRTGWYGDEPQLTPSLVESPSFQQAFSQQLTGSVYAQPLVADGALLVATEDNWVYALNPVTGQTIWKESYGTPVNALAAPIECTDLPTIGITATPVVDSSTNIAYFTSYSYEAGGSHAIAWYMHAIELANKGHEVSGFPVKIEGTAQNLAGVQFEPAQENQRPALLLMNGVVYAGFSSHCDHEPFKGWIAGVSTSGHLTTLWASAAKGAGIWQGGSGLISDEPGQLLFSTGNGGGEGGEDDPPKGPGSEPPEGRLGESVVRAVVQGSGQLKATDFFSPFENARNSVEDFDLGSSGPIALPSQYFGTPSVPKLLVQSGKQGYVYLLNREDLGGMGQGPGGSDGVVQRLPKKYGGVWDGAAVWPGDGGYVYIPAVSAPEDTEESGNYLRFFKYEVNGEGRPALSLAATSPDIFAFGSGSPIVTSNGTEPGSAVLWTTHCPTASCEGAQLRAYAAVPQDGVPAVLRELAIGQASKFSRPLASEGFVYLGNRQGRIYGFSAPRLSASSNALNLGETLTGGQLAEHLTFTNSGSTTLTVKPKHSPSAPFQVHGLPAEGVLQPGQHVTVEITFASTQAGHFSDSLSVTSQAGETSVSLSASAAAPEPRLSASTSSLELGEAPLGSSLAGQVTFTDAGNTSLTIKAEHAPAAPFAAQGLPAEGAVLRPGEHFTVEASFLSALPGHFADTLAVTTEAGETSVALAATATPAGGGASPILGGGTSPLVSPAPVATITLSDLRLRLLASTHGRTARVTYTLSAAAMVRVVVYRRVSSRHCARAALACGRYARTHLAVTVRGVRGVNLVSLPLAHEPAGVYRVTLTPLPLSGPPAPARIVYFTKLS